MAREGGRSTKGHVATLIGNQGICEDGRMGGKRLSSYSAADLDQLKIAVPIERVAQTRIKLNKSGAGWTARCPFHDDSRASFSIYTANDGMSMWCCHSCRPKGGNVFQFLELADRISFGEAVEKVKSLAGWTAGTRKVETVFQPLQTAPTRYETFVIADLEPAEKALGEVPVALAWLKQRGITLDTARKFHLGYVQSAGAISPQNGQVDDGWILFPTIRGEKVTLLKYRSVVSKAILRRAGMETSLYNLDAVRGGEDVFLVEGEPDALILTQAGYNTVALPGANFTVTPEMKDELLKANRIFLAGDNDVPGQQAMLKLWTELRDRTFLLKWPEKIKDANQDFLETCGGDPFSFADHIEDLKHQALTQPMPFMHDLAESMGQGDATSPMDNPTRLRFPWPAMDKWTAILPGDIVALSATETGTGKTSFLMNILLENAIKYNKVVVNYSAEVLPDQYARRAAAYLSGANRNKLTPADFKIAAERMQGARFYNGYKPGANWREVVDLLKWAKRRLGADILVIDHIHFLTRTEPDEIKAQSEAMRALKDLALEYGVIVIVVGQPRKSQAQHRGREMQMHDMKGSESISSDSSQIFLLHRDRAEQDETNPNPEAAVLKNETKVTLDKSRESEGRTTKLVFIGDVCMFAEMVAGGGE